MKKSVKTLRFDRVSCPLLAHLHIHCTPYHDISCISAAFLDDFSQTLRPRGKKMVFFSFSERTAGQSHEHLPGAASQGFNIRKVISLSGDSWMYPYQRTPIGNPYISPILWAFIGHNPQESLENTINIMGTLLGVHPIVPWHWILAVFWGDPYFMVCFQESPQLSG